MKKLNILLSLIVVLTSCSGNSQNKLKRYEIKSGIVKYTTTISGKVIGSTITGSGTESVYFKDWGAVELKEEQSTQTATMKFFGKKKTQITSTHTMNKLDNGESYLVDFDTKQIFLSRDMAMDMTKIFHPNADAGDVGKSMLESVGGKKIGTESILGYSCDVWDIKGAKQWMYKGIVLKMDITVLGLRTLTEATSAKFNITVPSKNFELPDFPIQKQEGFMNNADFETDMDDMDEGMDKVANMSFKEWKKLVTEDDPEMQEMSDKELRQTYDMIQKMIKIRKEN